MDEEEKKDDELELPEGALEEALEEETEDEEEEDLATGLDEFGAGVEGHEKQWE